MRKLLGRLIASCLRAAGYELALPVKGAPNVVVIHQGATPDAARH